MGNHRLYPAADCLQPPLRSGFRVRLKRSVRRQETCSTERAGPMADLVVHLEIPIPTEPLVGAPALTFARWLPIGDSQAIHVERGSIALKLWFDITSTWWASQHKEEDLPHMID